MHLDAELWRERARRVTLLACATHDLGKANDHFQDLVWGTSARGQAIRHEWVALEILEELREWILPALVQPTDWSTLLSAVVGHHRQPPPVAADDRNALILWCGHPDFRELIDWIGQEFQLGPPPSCHDRLVSIPARKPGSILRKVATWVMQAQRDWQQADAAERKLTALIKASLIAADVAGSALPRRFAEAEQSVWIATGLQDRPQTAQLEAIVSSRLNGAPLRPFQHEMVAAAARVTLVRAGCGSGKTLGAYHWAAASPACRGRRLYFCYPTTGTATEGYRAYLLDPETRTGRFAADLFHSRREVDLQMLGVEEHHADNGETEARIAALDAWCTPIVSCTVDTVLGLVQNQRRGLYAWPALSQAAFVFDEIHAYDDRLFGALMRFIQALRGVPILLMTASLPTSRREALREVLTEINDHPMIELAGPPELENLPRYRIQRAPGLNVVLAAIRSEFARGGSVLWVANTVKRCLAFAEATQDLRPLLYHSRFRYVDRVARHRAVIGAFDSVRSGRPVLAICSQVAEMSLDLSATLLVTDLAPVPALIQRLGRLNRRAGPASARQPAPPTMQCLVLEPVNATGDFWPWPYTLDGNGDWPKAVRQWLEVLGEGPRSQSDLAQAWETIDESRDVPRVSSTWLDGGPITEVGDLRETSPGIDVLLAGDLPTVESNPKRLAELVIPMDPPPDRRWQSWPRFRHVPVAAPGTIEYDPDRGARWRS